MKTTFGKIILTVYMFALTALFNYQTAAQTDKTKEAKTKSADTENIQDEARYIAPLRYVIVYNDIFQLATSERRMEVIVDEKQFSEENLIKVIRLIKQRFPLPVGLQIEIHTNLATIETPEERDKEHDSFGRLTDRFAFYKNAFYIHFDDGDEGLTYTTNLSPYKEKTIYSLDKPNSPPK